MSANEKPAWVGLFPDQDFEFRFGARPGDAIAFFADTAENTTLMEGRRTALEKSPAQSLFEEPSAAQAVVECSDWAGLDGSGCRELGLPVHAIHSPVPTLNENLGARIDKFLANLKPGKAWERSNWGLSRSAELNQHPTRDSRRRLLPPRHGFALRIKCSIACRKRARCSSESGW